MTDNKPEQAGEQRVMNLKGTFLIIGSGESYNTRIAQDGEGVFNAIIDLMFGEPENCDEPDYWRNVLADEDNWYSDHDLGPVHCGWDVGETDRIDIYRIESDEIADLRQKLAEAQQRVDCLQVEINNWVKSTRAHEIRAENHDLREQNIALRAQIATNKAAREWISVQDRLPSKDGRVIGYFPDAYGAEECLFAVENKKWFVSGHSVLSPTHWREMPEPPSELRALIPSEEKK